MDKEALPSLEFVYAPLLEVNNTTAILVHQVESSTLSIEGYLFDSSEDFLMSTIFTWSLTLASQGILDENLEAASSFFLSIGDTHNPILMVVPL